MASAAKQGRGICDGAKNRSVRNGSSIQKPKTETNRVKTGVNPVKYPVRMNKAMPGEEVAELLAGLCSKSAEPGPGGAHSWA
jgi:hypothetical protein